jgi:hypothetical protein
VVFASVFNCYIKQYHYYHAWGIIFIINMRSGLGAPTLYALASAVVELSLNSLEDFLGMMTLCAKEEEPALKTFDVVSQNVSTYVSCGAPLNGNIYY